MKKLLVLLVCMALTLPALASPSTRTDSAAIIASAKPAIEAANDDWLPAMRARDARRVAAPYVKNAVFILANGAAVRGHSSIENMYRTSFRKPNRLVSGTLVDEGLAASGGLVYEWGRAYMQVAQGNGKPVARSGNFLTVWRRNTDGDWKIIRNLVFSVHHNAAGKASEQQPRRSLHDVT